MHGLRVIKELNQREVASECNERERPKEAVKEQPKTKADLVRQLVDIATSLHQLGIDGEADETVGDPDEPSAYHFYFHFDIARGFTDWVKVWQSGGRIRLEL